MRSSHTHWRKSFVFAGKLKGVPLRVTIGATDIWSLDDARREARRLQTQIDNGDDPRQVKADKETAKEAEAAALLVQESRASATVSEVWQAYIASCVAAWPAPLL